MEKEFETYEYLVKYNGSIENDINTGQQIIIVQENGHLINVNKPIEYSLQEEDAKEFSDVTCPIYDISQQPVYYQLNNSSELIPISVNSVPMVEASNEFENTYMLPNTTVEVIGPGNDITNKHSDIPIAPILKEETESVDVDANKLSGGYAEITLSDEQYDILKEKGWILLEIKDKVFLLDSSGLHEITNDQELVTKLKHETSQFIANNSQRLGCSLKVVMIPENEIAEPNELPEQKACVQPEPMEIISGIETVQQEEIAHRVTQDSMMISEPTIPFKTQLENDTLINDNKNTVQTNNKPSLIRLKTQYLLKDIPKKIVLGKTINGKNLIARVVKGNGSLKNTPKTNKDIKTDVEKDRNINDKQFAKLVQQVLLGTAESCGLEDIASAETVVLQMFRVPDLRANLHKYKLIVTKTIREENEDGLIENQSEPTVVTGRFIMNGSEGGFVHIDDMLQQHMKNSELDKMDQDCENESEKTETAITDDDMFLHVNITETKDINNISRVSVMVNKRYLSLNQVYNMKTKHINAIYACTACAKVFKAQKELDNHQQYHCSEVPVLPAYDAQSHTIVKVGDVKIYMCNECKAKFVTQKDCREHLKLHYNGNEQEPAIVEKYLESSDDKKETDVFKCKMCDNTYFHSSSLTKHILAKHIKA